MDAAAEAEDLDRYHALNLRFHQRLVEASGNRRLLSIYSRLLNELHLFLAYAYRHGYHDMLVYPYRLGAHRPMAQPMTPDR